MNGTIHFRVRAILKNLKTLKRKNRSYFTVIPRLSSPSL
jgi:hypothetical protein